MPKGNPYLIGVTKLRISVSIRIKGGFLVFPAHGHTSTAKRRRDSSYFFVTESQYLSDSLSIPFGWLALNFDS